MNFQTNSRLLIVTNGNFFARLILDSLIHECHEQIAGILIVSGDYKGRSGFSAAWELARATALPYFLYKVMTIMMFKLAQLFKRDGIYTVEQLASRYEIDLYSVVKVNAKESLDWVAKREPDLLISVSCPQMIKRKMLSLPKLGSINIHSSLLPRYAGLAPYFWVLSSGEKTTGTTVHFMTLKFDEGNILVQESTPIEPGESAFHLFTRLAQVGNGAIFKAVQLVLQGSAGYRQDLNEYTYYSHPSFAAYRQLRANGHFLVRFGEILPTMRNAMQEPHQSQEVRELIIE